MKLRQNSGRLKACAILGLLPAFASAAVTISTSAPTVDVLHNNDAGQNIGGQIGNINGNNFQMRGDIFSLGDDPLGTAFEITAIVLDSNARTYNGSTMTVGLFEGTAASFGNGDGGTDADGIDSAFTTGASTPIPGVTVLTTEAFDLTVAVGGGSFVAFEFTTPVIVNENSDFGVLFDFDAEAGAAANFTYLYRESSSGGRLTVNNTANNTGSSRSMNFYVIGTAVPEPSSLGLLVLGGLAFARRRR